MSNIKKSCENDCQVLKETRQKLEEANTKLDVLLSNIPGGVLSYDANTGKFDFVSEGCLAIFQCTEEKFREQYYNSFELMVIKQDRAKVKELIDNQIQFFDTVELTYRVKDMMDHIMWIYHKGRLVKDSEGNSKFYIVISDITEEKLVQAQLQQINEKLYIETERYKLIEEAVDNIQYDYEVITDTLVLSLKDEDGNRLKIENYMASGEMKHLIHEEDFPTFYDMWVNALREPTKGVVEFQSCIEGSEYIWYRLSYASFADKNDRVVRLVGSAKNISEEKAEQEELKAKIELDGMTGLLNKVAMQITIENYIKDCDIGVCHAMIMIDTDNFKAVNDNLGHQYGDEAICFVANAIKETFRESDFIGRVGGDEFMVFMKHTTAHITEERAKVLNRAIKKIFEKDGVSVSISCSIGIAYYGRDGENYDILFKNADSALYEAKKSGKNQYRVFSNR